MICRPCIGLPCDNPADLASGVDSALYSQLDYSFVVQCPENCFCPPGLFPQTITILQSTIPPVIPPILEPGAPIILRLQGCTSLITRILSPDPSQAQIASAAQSMQAEWAGQQALCNAMLVPGVNCNTGNAINVCNDAQVFPCYDGTVENVPAGIRCKSLNITGLTQAQIDSATLVLKAYLNDQAKESFCPFHGIICGVAVSPFINIGFSSSQLRIANVSGVTKDITGFQWCQFGGAPPTFCAPPAGPPPTTVGPHATVVYASGASPLPIYFRINYLGQKIIQIGDALNPIPLSQGWNVDITIGCNG